MSGPTDGPEVEAQVKVRNPHGLHARPSGIIAEVALRFPDTTILIRRGDLVVDAKSIVELLLLAAAQGTLLTVVAKGPGAPQAIEALRELFEREFDLHL